MTHIPRAVNTLSKNVVKIKVGSKLESTTEKCKINWLLC